MIAATEAWLRGERRLGELIPATIKRGRPKKEPDEGLFSLADFDIDDHQSSRAQPAARAMTGSSTRQEQS
jgi:hypothetical protein